jgi:hypothetical protein
MEPSAQDHPLTKLQHLAAFAVAALFWGVGVTMIDPRIGVGVVLCLIGITCTVWIYWADLLSVRTKPWQAWPWLGILIIAVEILVPGWLLLSKAWGNETASVSIAADPPWIRATKNSNVNAKGSKILGTPPFRGTFVDANDGASVDVSDMAVIGADAPKTFPMPTGEFSRLSNADMKAQVSQFAGQLHQLQAEMDRESPQRILTADRTKLATYVAKTKEVRKKYSEEFASKFVPTARSMASELIDRAQKANVAGKVLISPEAGIGAQSILQGSLIGSANNVAAFLESFAKELPN